MSHRTIQEHIRQMIEYSSGQRFGSKEVRYSGAAKYTCSSVNAALRGMATDGELVRSGDGYRHEVLAKRYANIAWRKRSNEALKLDQSMVFGR